MDVTQEWFWEGNVVEAIARDLQQEAWRIVSKANTHSKERGVDLHAERNGTSLLVEAKGYPSSTYRNPSRAGQLKPTNPSNQAQHWYSHALLKVMRLQTKYPDALVVIGLPDFPRYRALFDETRGGLQKLGVGLLMVSKNGRVQYWGL